MKISILHKELEHFAEESSGFSVYLQADGNNILFDTSNDKKGTIILDNSKKLNIDLFNKTDYIVLSHGHYDHTNGLKALIGTKAFIVAHPDCFERKFYGELQIGAPFSKKEMEEKFRLNLSKEPYFITENIIFLGEIPRKMPFEAIDPIGKRENGKDDFVLDDSALAIKTKKGLIIVSGCSHAGLCNIIEYAKQVCKEEKIYALLGGFHLFEKEITDKTIEFIKKQKIAHIYPGHCLSDYAFFEFKKIGAKRFHTKDVLNI